MAKEPLSESLKKYKAQDPGFKKAIKAFAEAEAQHGKDDPVEGKIVSRVAKKGKPNAPKK